MHLQLFIHGAVECLLKTYGIQAPLDSKPDSCTTYGQPGIVIRQKAQGGRYTSSARLWGVTEASFTDENRTRLSHGTIERCIIPVSGFRIRWNESWYEVLLKDGSSMSCIGIWEAWQNAAGLQQEGVVLITTMANVLLAPFQKTMPIILHPSELDNWLQSERPLKQDLQRLASPYPSELMCITPLCTSE